MAMKLRFLQVTIQVRCGLSDIFFSKLCKSRADVHQVVDQMEIQTNEEDPFMLHHDHDAGIIFSRTRNLQCLKTKSAKFSLMTYLNVVQSALFKL